MKLKISFDKKSIVNFFLEHAEKVLLGLFILVFATIIYGAVMRREKFDQDPLQLVAKSKSTQRSLEGERPEKLKDLLKEQQARDDKGDYKKVADKITDFNKKGISVKPYECAVALDKPLFGQKGKRGQPELIGAEELRAAADFGVFLLNEKTASDDAPRAAAPAAPAIRPGRDPRLSGGGMRVAGNSTLRGKHWVVITGLVPVAGQAEAYRNAFRDAVAYDPANDDVPAYVDYYVERAEINSPADEKNPTWTQKFNSVDAVKDATQDWSQQMPDVVENRYIDPILTFPLGPLQNRTWGENVAHPKEIPLLNLYDTPGVAAEGENAGDGRDGNPVATRPQNVQMRDPRLMQGRPDKRTGHDSGSVEYKLLRFFDFSVEPGKSYIYRVSLDLKNPNYGVDAGKLEEAEFAKNKNRSTPVSQPTNHIDVPKDTQVLVGAAKSDDLLPGKFPVVLLTWAQKSGRTGYCAIPNVDHGQVLNVMNEKVVPVTIESPTAAPSDTEDIKADFITDATVLDMDGGKRLTGKGKLTEPREMLLMVLNGKSITLMLRNELDDISEVNRVTTKPETAVVPDHRTPEQRLFAPQNDPRRPPTRPR
jgi:hypothetical protein